MDRVGFVGLGVMGYPMSSYISKSGFQTYIYNRTSNISNKWKDSFHGSICTSPKELAKHVDFLCLCVSKDEDVKEVLCGKDGAIEGIKPGTIIIDHTTTSASLSREMHKIFDEINCHYLDGHGSIVVKPGRQGISRSDFPGPGIFDRPRVSAFNRVRPSK